MREKTDYTLWQIILAGILLTPVTIILKALHIIDWNWFLVLSPLWVAVGLVCLILIVAFAILLTKKNESAQTGK